MKKNLMLLSALSFIMIFFASIGGTYATWFFAEETSSTVNDSTDITISEFTWKPEEILPSTTPGQNYLDLLNSILNNSKNGLNSSKDALEKAVIKKGLLHSSYNIQGGNLKHLFINEACRELDFVIDYVSNTEFHVYMYKEADTKKGAVGVTEIEVYKSILIKENSSWIGKEAQFGRAIIQYIPNSSVLSIDIETWTC